MACSILVPEPRIELVPLVAEARSLNYLTTRKVPDIIIFKSLFPF